jgi:hypothetical protein
MVISGYQKESRRAPIENVLKGIDIRPLPRGWTPLEGIVLVKCLDEEGHPSWALRTTDGMNDEELLGALTVRIDLLRKELLQAYWSDEDDEDD